MTDLFALRRSLRDATTFADAAGVLIEHGKASLEEALEGAAIARGLVHLRTETRGYVAVLARDWSKAPSGAAQVAPSASAFALVERERAGVSIDVRAVRGERLGDGVFARQAARDERSRDDAERDEEPVHQSRDSRRCPKRVRSGTRTSGSRRSR